MKGKEVNGEWVCACDPTCDTCERRFRCLDAGPANSIVIDFQGHRPRKTAVKDGHEDMLRTLLAVIHRDGGHYAVQHGLKKATDDAVTIHLSKMAGELYPILG